MKLKRIPNFSLVITLLIILAITELHATPVQGQGGIRLRQPFGGTIRITAYVDHDKPDGNRTGTMEVYTGESDNDCPGANEAWTNQGPYCYPGHQGTDYALPERTPVLAAAPGTVYEVVKESQTGFGARVRIDHGNGYTSLYAHLTENSQTVSVGEEVIAGQQIALSGNSGNAVGFHLHFGVYYNGQPTDPFGWRGSGTDPIPGGSAVCLWGDGQCSETLVEDESAWFYKYGSGWDWYWTGNSWTLRRVANKSDTPDSAYARWRPDLPYEGPYSVFAFVPVLPAGQKTTNANYVVHDRAGNHSLSLNQSSFSERWVAFGNYDFWNGILGYVYLGNATGETAGSKQVVFDAVKFSQWRVYLPDVRSSNAGWDSALYLRNDGDAPTNVMITLFNPTGGSPVSSDTYLLDPDEQLYFNPSLTGWQGAAVVRAAEPVSVMVIHQYANPTPAIFEAYTGVSQPTAAVHVPLLHKNNSGWDSELYIQNTGARQTNISVNFKASTGSSCSQPYNDVPPNGLQIIDLNTVSCIGSPFIGSAYITNTQSQPLAVATTQYLESSSLMEESNAGGIATTVYAPLIQNYNSNWVSGTSVQNASGSTNTILATFRRENGPSCFTDTYSNLGARFARISPTTPGGACPTIIAAVYAGGSGAVAATINHNQLGTNHNSDYAGVAAPSQTVSVPLWMKNWGGWISGLVVQNINSQSTQVTLTFYDMTGNVVASDSQAVGGNGFHVFLGLPSGFASFMGSAVVTADRPVAVAVDHSRSDVSDGIMSHIGVHR